MRMPRKSAVAGAVVLLGVFVLSSWAQRRRAVESGRVVAEMTQILGRPTDRSIVLSVLAPDAGDVFIEYGPGPARILSEREQCGSLPRNPPRSESRLSCQTPVITTA